MQFRIHGLSTQEFSLVGLPVQHEDEQVALQLDTRFEAGLFNKASQVVIRLHVRARQEDNELCRLVLDLYVELKEPLEQNAAGQRILPKQAAAHLAAIAYASARGVLHEKLQNTTLQPFVLPSRNVTQDFPEDVLLDGPEPSSLGTGAPNAEAEDD